MYHVLRAGLVAASLLTLSGCGGLLGKAPKELITLSPSRMAPAGSMASGNAKTAIAMADFEAPQALDLTRVPVTVTDSKLQYVKGAVWNEKPARLLRRLVAETIRAKTDRLVIDGDDPGALAEVRVSGVLRQFGLDARTNEVVLILDAAKAGAGSSVITKRFEARVPAPEVKPEPIGAALNEVANKVAEDVAAWVA